MAENTGTSYSTDPALYIYTSLTAGSSHIVTATSRLETILRANRVPFKAIDIATDDKARMLWGRRAGKDEGGRQRKLPALIQMGMVLGVSCFCLPSWAGKVGAERPPKHGNQERRDRELSGLTEDATNCIRT
ncbi:hypothetical protein RRF57_003780 [Xylaria bambusicola]|uniref:Uncharacterized protein n=1 Tax=Xylaria bambusicola TaxID=326684 RepID=A0AAN7U8W8_9PEZI